MKEGDIVDAEWVEDVIRNAIVLHTACATGDLTIIMDSCGVKHYINQGCSSFEGFVLIEEAQ